VSEADNYVGYLHARVVDVVLNIDFPARSAQQPHKRVAKNGVAQVTDVRGLVGIDAGVLDQNLAEGTSTGGLRSAASSEAIHARSILTFR
jgi:hypothetical protein